MNAAHPAIISDLTSSIDDHLRRSALIPEDTSVMVALSGGTDSTALLHLLLELAPRWRWTLSAAHFDHRMRAESVADAEWVRGLCEDLGVPHRLGRAARVPRSEGEARDLRYEFLFRARRDLGADLIATAHQADDQLETVIFRILRGTGTAGVCGIPTRRAPGIVRPLLTFRRADVEGYLAGRELSNLEDPTNAVTSYARNWIRHVAIPHVRVPELEGVLSRFSAVATRLRASLRRSLRQCADRLILDADAGRIVVAREDLLAYDTKTRLQLLRHLLARVGRPPGRIGTLSALEFIKDRPSGRRLVLAGGVELRREFDRLVIERAEADAEAEEAPLLIADHVAGEGVAIVGGVSWQVGWRVAPAGECVSDDTHRAGFAVGRVRPPLVVRGWRPGDRMRTAAGRRKLKKVFADRRIGISDRKITPLLADASEVHWVIGNVRGRSAVPGPGEEALIVEVRPSE